MTETAWTKADASGGGNCVEHGDLKWRKASASTANGHCIELAPLDERVAMRDSKDPDGPVLVHDGEAWLEFLEAARDGEFDHLLDS